MRGEHIQRRGIGDLPAVERRPFVLVGMDDDALLAVVHAQRQRAATFVDSLHAEKPRAIGGAVFQIAGADTDIAERIEIHRFNPRVDRRFMFALSYGDYGRLATSPWPQALRRNRRLRSITLRWPR